MSHIVPLLARNEAINRWLSDNPLVLTLIAALLAAALLYFGIRDVTTGQATGKWGTQHEGGTAVAIGIVRIVGGIVFVVVALYGLTRVFS